MPLLRLSLLGSVSLHNSAGEAVKLAGRKGPALVAYMALQRGASQERDNLAALLWPEATHARARHNLRQLLVELRRAVSPPWFKEVGETIALDLGALEVDAVEFERLAAGDDPEDLLRAAALYRGDLLAGLGEQSAPYEDWLLSERERLRELALGAFAKLLRHQLATEAIEPAIHTALRVLALEPAQEAAHRTLMRLYARQGRRAAALRQYQLCVGALQRELGAEPEEATGRLYREILSATVAPANTMSAAPAERAVELPIIGRAEAIGRFRAALSLTLDGGGRTLLVAGEAGIGKTRLLTELVREAKASGAWVAIGRCHESERGLPLHPWVDALRGQRPTLDPGLRELLSESIGRQLARVFPELGEGHDEPVTNAEHHLLLFDALTELVRKLAGGRLAVVVIEDLHWADAMSARFVASFARRVGLLSALLALSVRPEEVVDAPVVTQVLQEMRAAGAVDEIAIGPLTRGESEKLVRGFGIARRTAETPERVIEDIWTIGRGNPFVMVEAVRELQQSRAIGRPASAGLSARVEDSVGRRLDRLARDTRHLVNIAATIGRDFSFELIHRASRLGDAEAAIAVDELVRRHLLEAVGDRLDFSHEWIRQVAYRRLLPPLRASAHQAVAETLEPRGEDFGELSNEIGGHYARAGDWRRALPHLARSAEIAVQRYALDDALATLAYAMTGAEQLADPERGRWQLRIALQEAFVMSLQGRQHDIIELLRTHAGLLLQVDDPALTSDYYMRRALVHWYQGEHAEAELVAAEALRAAERAGSPERAGRAQYVLALNCAGLGRPLQGIERAERAVAVLDACSTRHWAGLAYFALALNQVIAGQLDGAFRSAERCIRIGEAERDSRLTSMGGYLAAWVEVHRGNLDLAIDIATRSLKSARDALATCLAQGVLGWAALERGDAEAAIAHLHPAVDRMGAMPLQQTEGRFLPILSAAYLRSGDTAHAVECTRRAQQLSRADGNPLTRALAERAIGRIACADGRLDEAAQLLGQALDSFERIGAKVEAALTCVELADLFAACGDRVRACNHLSRAAGAFEGAGAYKRAVAARERAAQQPLPVEAN
jgi:DNA-binding SARP family transcriptional activator